MAKKPRSERRGGKQLGKAAAKNKDADNGSTVSSAANKLEVLSDSHTIMDDTATAGGLSLLDDDWDFNGKQQYVFDFFLYLSIYYIDNSV